MYLKTAKEIKKLFKKVFNFCTMSPFENDYLHQDLQQRINQIKEENSKKIIKEVIKPNIQKQFFNDTNMLMPDKQALEMAVNIFIYAKEQGRIDELNNIVDNYEVL